LLQEKVIPAILSHTAKYGEAFERAQDKFRVVYLNWLHEVRQGLFPQGKRSGWYKNFEFGIDAFAAIGVCLAQASRSLFMSTESDFCTGGQIDNDQVYLLRVGHAKNTESRAQICCWKEPDSRRHDTFDNLAPGSMARGQYDIFPFQPSRASS